MASPRPGTIAELSAASRLVQSCPSIGGVGRRGIGRRGMIVTTGSERDPHETDS